MTGVGSIARRVIPQKLRKTRATRAEACAAEGPRCETRIDSRGGVKAADTQKPNLTRPSPGSVRGCVALRLPAGRIRCKGKRRPKTERAEGP